jgi:ATP-dependent helicase/nuclease subunit A
MAVDPQNQTMQKAADTSKSVHLSASAGSGKTRALKERYLALLERLDRNGFNIDQAVAITFTDKAAAEIKERVMRDLPESTLKKIIRGTQGLRISTIHSFCMNLLKRYPLEAGLPPDFGVLDSRDQAYKIQKAIEDTLEKSGHDPEIMLLLGNFTVDEIITKIEHLISIRSRLRRMEIDAGGPEDLVQAFRHGMEVEAAEIVIEKLILSIEWRTSFERMEQLLKSEGEHYSSNMGLEHRILAKAQNPASAFKTAGAVTPVYFTIEGAPRKSAKIAVKTFKAKKNRQEYENLFFKIQELLYRLKNAYLRTRSSSEAVSLLRLYLRAEEQYRELKLREGFLDFDDLEIFAYRLLQGTESPDILYWLDRKILHFLVDEFQDTSDIQWAILKKLTEEIFSGLGTDKPMFPTLFVVGDEKQSIYRFREANYRLIHDIREQIERNIPPESREILSLEKNFRSTPEIIGTVNRVFSGLWSQSYKASESERREHAGSVKLIEVLQGTTKDSASPAAEAEVLASEIHYMVQSSTMVYERISDPDSLPRAKKRNNKVIQADLFSGVDDAWIMRPAGYGDCAVLIQSRTKLKEYEVALQARSIPYRVVGGIGFYEEDEIQALMNILFFLWNRDDILCLVAALKSPLFGLTDDDIVRCMENDGSITDALNLNKPEIGRLLSNWTGIARLVPISGLIHRIVEESCAYVRFGRRNPQAIFNIDKLLDTAREFDRRGYTTLQDFVVWVKNIRRTEQREATSDMNLPGFQGSVSIMTVHKAKGLEYPIVFLPGMNQFARSLSIGPETIIHEADGQKRMAIRAADNPIYDDLWKGDHGEQEELRREHQRLLYVAMTRARDHLVMLGTLINAKNPIRQNTWLDFLHRTLPLRRESADHAASGIITHAFPDWLARTRVAEQKTERQTVPEQWIEAQPDVDIIIENMSPLPLSEGLEWKRATDFIKQMKETAVESNKAIEISSLTRGSVLHRCLEEFTKHGAYDLGRIIKEFPGLAVSGDFDNQSFAADVLTVLTSVLDHNDFAWIFKRSKDSYSELPFLYRKENTIISGKIDRVVIRENTGLVIDYKAIRIDDEASLAALISNYRPQIRIYCNAVKELFGLKNVEGYLLFLDSCRLQLASKV